MEIILAPLLIPVIFVMAIIVFVLGLGMFIMFIPFIIIFSILSIFCSLNPFLILILAIIYILWKKK